MILETMLQRLFASLVSGPSMNARPHNSRQRCDFMDLAAFMGLPPESSLKELLEKKKLDFPARVPAFQAPSFPESEWSDDQKAARDAWNKQSKLLKKLRDIAEDARDYLNDHGESCLAIGFPLLSIPPSGDDRSGKTSRILAPLLLMPVELQVRTASRPGITLEAHGEGADLLIPNPALLAWIERQTGKTLEDIFSDETASDPWREVTEILTSISGLLGLEPVASFDAQTLLNGIPSSVDALPKGTQVMSSAVLGLFPLSNQSLLRDTRWMLDHQTSLQEPVSAFLNPQALHSEPESTATEADESEVTQIVSTHKQRDFSAEWLVSNADPCQANAVLASREARALVVHGPPGTGKSQTIMNMIADHLARGERILFVCDKRTALDVVKYRLDAAGLGHLAGVVHDPSGDRKDFYMGLRAQLENLADTPLPEDPRSQLELVNRQLSAIHMELEGYRRKLQTVTDSGAASFHDLLGEWMALAMKEDLPDIQVKTDVSPAELADAHITLEEISRRAIRAGYRDNFFKDSLRLTLAEFMSLPTQETQQKITSWNTAAQSADEARLDETFSLQAGVPFNTQAAMRRELAAKLRELSVSPALAFAQNAATLAEPKIAGFRAELQQGDEWLSSASSQSLDRALLTSFRSTGMVNLATVNQHVVSLLAWQPIADSFFKQLFAGQVKKQANAAVLPLGLPLKTGWAQALQFYQGLKFRLLLSDLLGRIDGSQSQALRDDADVESQYKAASLAWQVQAELKQLGKAADLPPDLNAGSQSLEAEAVWADKLHELVTSVQNSNWFKDETLTSWLGNLASGNAATDSTHGWQRDASSMEDVIRLEASLQSLSVSLQAAVKQLASEETPAEIMFASLKRMSLENELRRRLHADPELAAIDGERIEAAFNSFHDLSNRKRQHVRDYIKYLWIHHQRKQLLASTGSQLNKNGAALRSRLYVRGKKALKLRQMLATGFEVEGGDPIYDLCPVWMASPSTVAQIFPRQAIFDVVVFDEASQCRLEEALPVLLRGHRVVIAGDQKQLPPTRFFEQTLSDTADTDAETPEELFYQQQSDAVDLLSAALNLDVKEAYLDVHYRSRNEALIGFSNQHYYGTRLQPIPGHPQNKARNTPIKMHRVEGVYDQRTNVKEAEAAAALVADLLDDPNPPSIGVACFNLTQRDVILDALSSLAERDAAFARNLEIARQRKGRDSFEGLFVKNLENVQGDERDVMIISTTFGPDSKGKFRRNFGALSQREGGRRLNVLVTRARDAVHVLTSIPVAEYTAVQDTPPGHVPNGRLQLYSYLQYADKIAAWFENYQSELEKMARDSKPEKKVWNSATPSKVADSLSTILLENHQIGTEVHWGNDGFCVDIACVHPVFPADVTVGVLTDFSRFHKTPDAIEWDLFRTTVLRNQGWQLERLWSPVLFRRKEEALQRLEQRHLELIKPEGQEEETITA